MIPKVYLSNLRQNLIWIRCWLGWKRAFMSWQLRHGKMTAVGWHFQMWNNLFTTSGEWIVWSDCKHRKIYFTTSFIPLFGHSWQLSLSESSESDINSWMQNGNDGCLLGLFHFWLYRGVGTDLQNKMWGWGARFWKCVKKMWGWSQKSFMKSDYEGKKCGGGVLSCT